jgi:hypothetical protein
MLSNEWIAGIDVFSRREKKKEEISIYLSHSYYSSIFISATSSSIAWHRQRICPQSSGLI